uniref:Maturase K n=1 Tax=Romanomermis culicivorax TaxID=13658 RepID=A0A915HDW2_ROMCU
ILNESGISKECIVIKFNFTYNLQRIKSSFGADYKKFETDFLNDPSSFCILVFRQTRSSTIQIIRTRSSLSGEKNFGVVKLAYHISKPSLTWYARFNEQILSRLIASRTGRRRIKRTLARRRIQATMQTDGSPIFDAVELGCPPPDTPLPPVEKTVGTLCHGNLYVIKW